MQHSAVSVSGLSLSMNVPWAFTVGQPVLVLLSSMPVPPSLLSVKCDVLALLSVTSLRYQIAEPLAMETA